MSRPGVDFGTICGPARMAPDAEGPPSTSVRRSQVTPSTEPPTTLFTSASAWMRVAASCSNAMTVIAAYPPSSPPDSSTARNSRNARDVPAAMLRIASDNTDPSLIVFPPVPGLPTSDYPPARSRPDR